MSTEQAWSFVVGILVLVGLVCNTAFFAANLKLYTEIMKEKSQRERKP